MLKSVKVAVTGGLACGKSSVCKFLEQLGATIVNADEIVHSLLSSDQTLVQEVITLLGEKILVEGKLDRKAIADRVFQSPKKLKELEALIHPRVFEEIERHRRATEGKAPLFVVEIPLLFETSSEDEYDATVAVVSRPEVAAARGALNEYRRRAEQQLPIEEKAQRADYVIENNGTLEELEASVEKIYNQLINQRTLDR